MPRKPAIQIHCEWCNTVVLTPKGKALEICRKCSSEMLGMKNLYDERVSIAQGKIAMDEVKDALLQIRVSWQKWLDNPKNWAVNQMIDVNNLPDHMRTDYTVNVKCKSRHFQRILEGENAIHVPYIQRFKRGLLVRLVEVSEDTKAVTGRSIRPMKIKQVIAPETSLGVNKVILVLQDPLDKSLIHNLLEPTPTPTPTPMPLV